MASPPLLLALALAALAVLVFFSLLQWLGWLFLKLWRSQPPGPFPLPILGNLLYIISSSSSPHNKLHDLSRKYGPLFFLQLGVESAVVATSPEAAQQIFSACDRSLANRPFSQNGRDLFYGDENTSFLCPYGDKWRFTRKFYSLHVLSSRGINELHFPVAAEEIARAIKGPVYEASVAGTEVNYTQLVLSLLQSITYRVVIGKDPTEKLASVICELADESERLLGARRIGEFLPILKFLDYKTDEAIAKCHGSTDKMLEQVISERERREGSNYGRKCVLDVLIAADPPLDRAKLKAMAWEVLVAGIRTSVTTLDWAMAELVDKERVMKKAMEEVDSVVGKKRMVTMEDLKQMPYLKAVVTETFRLHPPGPLILPRAAIESCDVELRLPNGSGTETYRIRAGSRVIINVWAIGRDETIWGSDAAEFRPERFLDGGSKQGVSYRGQHYELLPFGGGRRLCPGIVTAIPIIELAIASFIHSFHWTTNELPVDMAMTEDFGLSVPRRSHLLALPGPFRLDPQLLS